MGNKIFDTILLRKIENFVSTFGEDSNSIFKLNEKLIHPAEYGKYRENALKDLLQVLTKFKVSDGFVITSNEKVSTQCDVVVYDNLDFPVLENNLAQFFSIESVISIGEVKSTLNKAQFKSALRKLAENKKLSENINGKPKLKVIYGDEYNSPISFLVCKNLKFELEKIDYDEIYKGIPKIYWHNLILIVDQGLSNYTFATKNFSESDKSEFVSNGGNINLVSFFPNKFYTYNNTTYECNTNFLKVDDQDQFKHIKMFITGFSQAILYKTIFQTQIVHYMNYEVQKLFQT
ncbi:DUF6602 domain-containing protein [Flavobacterium gyeonganense]|uniref:DUF6602 domain-containing protein n=1 Tax=Flavobacterium gyeonganense TaxID=1310418 RepID=A0ABV5HF79_9FLAO|nr:DUF6602 domain-containing protein [Flavobacterium gyeonganense]